mmetsp:Transcript_153876/g.271642  ORF Transcript_153876/g.271642 Transcript_153876/m.271642 type:complete len:141 (+) Transcript_153876:95-517(+)
MAFSKIVAGVLLMFALLTQAKLHEKKINLVASNSKAHAMQPADKDEGDWGHEFGHAKDPAVLKWKTAGSKKTPSKLPSQGFEGKPVTHANQKTVTKDWSHEYGPVGGSPATPAHSLGVRGATLVCVVSALPLCLAAALMA